MGDYMQSYTIVPSSLYIERDADRQIKTVIQSMTRPGYILVARQMGKTNLLLHTKEVMEDSRNVYAYIDFNCTVCNTASECFDEIIDVIIDTHEHIYSEESAIIEERRSVRKETSQREFTRDLRLLLKKVDRLIIVMDEIDALVKMPFSDNVFSLIRSHYFQRKNYPDMAKLSYLLSGVIEPKNIIKNPDISPFNIGQEIYVKDFTRAEFDSFVEKSGLKGKFPQEVYNRAFYWTNGHPRITWDLCQLIDVQKPRTSEDLDAIVERHYLATCDKAPIDSIRPLVANDQELRDAVMQIIYERSENFSADLKKKLYLAGIINYEDTTIRFKNPIIERSLPKEWLMTQGNTDLETQKALERARRLIFINKDYYAAQIILETIQETSEEDKGNDYLYYLMGECYYRLYTNKKSLTALEKIDSNSNYYYAALYLIGSNYYALDNYEKALEYYKKCVKDNDSKPLLLKAKLGIVETLSEMNENKSFDEAETILKDIISNQSVYIEDGFHSMVHVYYYTANLYQKKGDNSKALSFLDSALSYAYDYELPVLLYKKLMCSSSDESKADIIKSIVKYIKESDEKPVMDDYDNVLTFSKYYALLIFAEVILNYPELIPEIEPKFRWFYEKKEDLYCTICATLNKNKLPQAKELSKLIIKQMNRGEMELMDVQAVDIFSIWTEWAKNKDEAEEIGGYFYNYLSNLYSNVTMSPILIRPLMCPLIGCIKNRDFDRIRKTVILAQKWFNVIPNSPIAEEHFIMTSFYSSIVAFWDRNYKWFMSAGCMYLSRIEFFMSVNKDNKELDVSISSLEKSVQTLMSMGNQFKNEIEIILGIPTIKPNRNDKVKVKDLIHQRELTGKYKSFEREVESGFYEIKEVVNIELKNGD